MAKVDGHRAAMLRAKLGDWANDMVTRFGPGTHVYVVGSYVRGKHLAKDTDVVIVVPDDLFMVRYGAGLERDWREHETSTKWTDAHYRCAREVCGLVRGLSLCIGGLPPPDLKVQSKTRALHHAGKPRVRVDHLDTAEKQERP